MEERSTQLFTQLKQLRKESLKKYSFYSLFTGISGFLFATA